MKGRPYSKEKKVLKGTLWTTAQQGEKVFERKTIQQGPEKGFERKTMDSKEKKAFSEAQGPRDNKQL